MLSTSLTLLDWLRAPDAAEAWSRFVRLYTPLLFDWARRLGLSADEAGDLVQDVFVVLVQELPRFSYRPDGSFRAWLKTITLNRWRNGKKRLVGAALDPARCPDPADQFE